MPRDLPPFARGRPLVEAAAAFADRHHELQRRESDDAPFLMHPLEVASLLFSRGYADEVVAAGLLHDVVEKTEATIDEVRSEFGERTAALVDAVTEDASVGDYEQRKTALRRQVASADADALAIYAADKLAKTRELRALAAREHVSLSEPSLAHRLDHYEDSLELVAGAAPDVPFLGQLRFELWALRQLPPA